MQYLQTLVSSQTYKSTKIIDWYLSLMTGSNLLLRGMHDCTCFLAKIVFILASSPSSLEQCLRAIWGTTLHRLYSSAKSQNKTEIRNSYAVCLSLSWPKFCEDKDHGYLFDHGISIQLFTHCLPSSRCSINISWMYASLVAQTVKNLPAMRETWVWSLDQEDPLEKEMATHSSIHAWRTPWTEGPGGL